MFSLGVCHRNQKFALSERQQTSIWKIARTCHDLRLKGRWYWVASAKVACCLASKRLSWFCLCNKETPAVERNHVVSSSLCRNLLKLPQETAALQVHGWIPKARANCRISWWLCCGGEEPWLPLMLNEHDLATYHFSLFLEFLDLLVTFQYETLGNKNLSLCRRKLERRLFTGDLLCPSLSPSIGE